MKKILIVTFIAAVTGCVGYGIGLLPSIGKTINQGQVETGYQFILREWDPESELLITEPVSASRYEKLTSEEKNELWKKHPYHSVNSIIDLLSAIPTATSCCDAPKPDEEVRYITPDPNNPRVLSIVVRKNGDLIIAKATINVPSFSW